MVLPALFFSYPDTVLNLALFRCLVLFLGIFLFNFFFFMCLSELLIYIISLLSSEPAYHIFNNITLRKRFSGTFGRSLDLWPRSLGLHAKYIFPARRSRCFFIHATHYRDSSFPALYPAPPYLSISIAAKHSTQEKEKEPDR